MATLSATISQDCTPTGGRIRLTSATPGPGVGENLSYAWTVLDVANTDFGGPFDPVLLPVAAESLPNNTYRVQVTAVDADTGASYVSVARQVVVSCTGSGGDGGTGVSCDIAVTNLVVSQPAAVGGTGTVRMSISTRYPPFTGSVTRLSPLPEATTQLVATQPGVLEFSGVAIGSYQLNLTDAQQCATVATYAVAAPAPVVGCMDADASNFNPLATESDPRQCSYTPRWVGVWSPEGVPVRLRPTATPTPAYLSADLYAGFPVGHSLADVRPLTYVETLRATVGLDGVASFDLAPYLRSELGSQQADGSRRLDLNSPTALTDDLYVGFRLEVEGRGVASGYALNSVLPESRLEELRTGQDPVWPFGITMPRWPGFDYVVSCLVNDTSGRLGKVEAVLGEADGDNDWRVVHLPCPSNALPVAWLSPEGGFGYWVFRGNHSYGDDIGEGAPYQEALTNELRYSSRAASRQTVEATSGVFSDRALVEGLRTLRRAVQAWYRPGGATGPWVPIVLKGGSFPAYREGRRRYELSIQFSEAAPLVVQGQ